MTQNHDLLNNPYAQTLIRIKARQLCRRADFSRSDLEDLHQEMRMYLLKVGPLFDPSRARMETFIARAINSCVAMILRDRRRDKRRIGIECVSLEGTELPGDNETFSLWSELSHDAQARRTGTENDDPVAAIDTREAFDLALQQLSNEERQIAALVIKHGKAARLYGTSCERFRYYDRYARAETLQLRLRHPDAQARGGRLLRGRSGRPGCR